MAGKQVQRRRGTTAQHNVFTGALGEVTVDTVKMVEVVHDGSTPGGFPQASYRDIQAVMTDYNQKLALKVSQDSATGVAKVPKGTTGQRPATPQDGDFRFNTTTRKFEGYATDLGWTNIGSDSIPLFSVFWVPLRGQIPAGFVVADGQLLARATYPDAAAGVLAGNVPIATEAVWNSAGVYKGYYTTGDGSTTFRVPDYNGKSANNVGAVFLRGDGANSGVNHGLIQQSANLSHTHPISSDSGGSIPVVAADGGTAKNAANKLQYLGNDALGNYPLYVVGSGGTESRPVNVTGTWCIKLFGAVINPGAADAAQLATEVANIKADLQNNYYKRSNIVGTVSQSGGVNTGAIIQAGGNANGMFLRLADGTQFCYQYLDQGGVGITAPMGPLFYRAMSSLAFPISFIQFPFVNMSIVTGGGVAWAVQGTSFPSTTQTQGWYVLNPISISTSGTAMYFAEGRWI